MLRAAATFPVVVVSAEKKSGDSSGVNWFPPPSPLSLSKPTWVVKTESNVYKEKVTKPDNPCVLCHGNGKVLCQRCLGRGRTNKVHLAMLPKGEWPKWCKTCGGSGLDYCSRCLGTGEYRDIMGFHFMKMQDNLVKTNHGNGHPQ